MIAGLQAGKVRRQLFAQIPVGTLQHIVDHAGQTHGLAVMGGINSAYTVLMEVLDFGRDDDAATAAKHLDVGAPALGQQIDHVLEILHMASLVGTDGDSLGVFLNRRGDDLVHGAVMAQMDDFRPRALQDASHDVDRRIVTVE